jgi:tetratricopeptide (TPR) repeat protein
MELMTKRGKECPRLSVVMILRNAEDCLATTLDSVSTIADELVVYDTGSTDQTVSLAQQKATRVVPGHWRDSFSIARNEALQHATGDWVLWLDAGEVLSPETAQALRRFVDMEAKPQVAYYCLIKTPQQNLEIAGEQVAQIRLHVRNTQLQYEGVVRESLLSSIERLGMEMEGLPFVIQRSMRENEPEIRRARADRNIHLATLALKAAGPVATLFNCLGEACQWVGDHAGSAESYRKALELSARGSADMLEAYYGILTALEGSDASRDAQLQLCMTALEVFPLDAQLLCAIGGYLQARGQWELASRAYQLAAEHGQINLQIWHLEGLTEIAVNCYAQTLQVLNREEEAVELLTKELSENPASPRLRRQLLELHVKSGRQEQAEAIVNAMPWNAPHRESLRSAVRGACMAASGQAKAAQPLLETAYQAGCRDPICLRWLTGIYFAMGQIPMAEKCLKEWLLAEPYSLAAREVRQQMEERKEAGHPSGSQSASVRIDAAPSVPKPIASVAAAVPSKR